MTSFLRSTSRRFSLSKDVSDHTAVTALDVSEHSHSNVDGLDGASQHSQGIDNSSHGGGIGGSFRMWRMRSSSNLTDASHSNHDLPRLRPMPDEDLVEEEEEDDTSEVGTDLVGDSNHDDMDSSVPSLRNMRNISMKKKERTAPRRQDTFESVDTFAYSSDDDEEEEQEELVNDMDASMGMSIRDGLRRMSRFSMRDLNVIGSAVEPTRKLPQRQGTTGTAQSDISSDTLHSERSFEEQQEARWENDMDASMGMSIRDGLRRMSRFNMRDLNVIGSAVEPTRKLPQRQGTTETAQSDILSDTLHSERSFEEQQEAQWEEERVELLEKVEALEQKLETKEAVLQCLLPPTSEKNIADPTALLKAKVQEQALYIEELEEAQHRPCEPSLWERVEEQNEKITRMEAAHEYQMQQQLIKQRHLEDLVRKIQLENPTAES